MLLAVASLASLWMVFLALQAGDVNGALLFFGFALLLGLVTFAAGLCTLGAAAIVHLVTLPTEFDASFGRALPMLDRHAILIRADRPHARRLLTAAALTYVAASLMSLLNIARWIAILRR
jgi:hypothetical protein